MDLRHRVVLLRAHLVVARAERRWRRDLARSLGAYATQRERDDLLATLDRYPDAETRVYREVLMRPASPSWPDRWPATGRDVAGRRP
ncbi:hypothetical protein [Kineosporia sp. R_H_3]|uniref:hypothetical protein n=1 Tax=Kineosporia sp. R_H_3 TaxID=1961848 RepID=UPI000B4C156D|nr:hypothetical protein [Kineosporia sp. R_H_3]